MDTVAATASKLEGLRDSVFQALEARAKPDWAESTPVFDKNVDYVGYGLSAADHEAVYREFREAFRAVPLVERLQLAEMLLAGGIAEQANVGVHLWALSVDTLQPEHFEHLDRGLERSHSWGTTDSFCINVLQPLLLRYTDDVLQLLRKWNRSGNPWKRRASVVAFTRKIGASGEFTDEALELCENLIWDEDDLVQKGIGWALKDTMRGAKERVIEYVKDLRRRGVPSTITLYAIRDLKGEERKALLAIRGRRA